MRVAVFVRSEKSNALVGDGVLQPAPRSANLDSAFDGMQLFASEAWRAAPRLLTRSAQLTQPTVRLPQQGTYEKKQSLWLLALSVFLQLLPNHQATINFGSILPTRGLTPAVLRWSGFTPADSFATLGLEICGRLSKKKCTLG